MPGGMTTMIISAVPRLTKACVRTPAALPCMSRFNPISAPTSAASESRAAIASISSFMVSSP